MKHPIIPLPQEQWQDAVLPIGYTTTEYYDVSLEQNADGFSLSIQKKPLEEPITRTPQEHDFPDRLFAAHWQGARAWGIVEDCVQRSGRTGCVSPSFGWTRRCKSSVTGTR